MIAALPTFGDAPPAVPGIETRAPGTPFGPPAYQKPYRVRKAEQEKRIRELKARIAATKRKKAQERKAALVSLLPWAAGTGIVLLLFALVLGGVL